MYNLYIPEDYSTQKEYPLILFMADASADGDDVMINPAPGKWGGGLGRAGGTGKTSLLRAGTTIQEGRTGNHE